MICVEEPHNVEYPGKKIIVWTREPSYRTPIEAGETGDGTGCSHGDRFAVKLTCSYVIISRE
jgi:hypothetical protein